ncbi:MAG: ABC transporter ATP-binding protein [Thermodesulfobacteriota bacterium]
MRTDYGYFEEKELGKPYDVKLLRRLYPFSRPYHRWLLSAIVLVVMITVLDLSLPYVTKIAIDRYIVPDRPQAAAGASAAPEKGRIRYLTVNLADADIRAVVDRYRDRFSIDGTLARIAYADLSVLTGKDLAILRKDDLSGVSRVTALFLLLVILSFVLNFLQEMIMEIAGQRIMHDLRVQLFNHIQSLSVAFFTRNPVGRLVTRVTNDVQNMQELFTSVIVFVFKDLFLLAGIAVVLLSIHWKLALVSFAVLPFVAYASMTFSGHAREAFRLLRIKVAEINTRLSETLGGLKVLQLFGREQENYLKFEKLNHENYLAGMLQIRIFAVFMPVIELLGVVALAVVIFYGGSRVLEGSISLGALVAFISYVKMFFRPIRDIAEKYNVLQNAMASAERIFLILDERERLPQPLPENADRSLATDKIRDIRFHAVSFSYVAGERVLKCLSFSVRAGEVLAVVGPTGSGKTTLIQLLIRFYDPDEGEILINGRSIRQIETPLLRSKIALVTQDPFLFSGSIRENIAPGRADMSETEMNAILQRSNCRHLIDKLPGGLDTVLSEGGASISSGERQLISIARAFAHNPDLIIFDEATSYVDSETEQKIQGALFNLMKNRTSIIIAHRLLIARNADRILVVNRGRVVESGTHAELIGKKGFYFNLNQLQG